MILQPYDMEVGAGTFHPATTLRSLGPEAVEGGLCPALAPSQGRPLRREPQPAAALLPVPGDPEAVAGEPAGALSRLARRDRRRHGAARRALRRGRLGEPDARRLGPRLGMLVRRHGSLAVHLLPAGRRLRMRAGVGRADLRARAARDVRAGRRQHLRPQLQRPRRRREDFLWRRVPASRAGIFALQFRARQHRAAVPALQATPRPNAARCSRRARRASAI